MGSTSAANQSAYKAFEKDPKTTEEFFQRAEEVSALLSTGVSQRDLDNVVPLAEVQLLKQSGLVTAVGPIKYGGGGLTFADALKITRIIARGDGSIGQLLGYHYFWTQTASIVGTAEQAEAEAERYTTKKLFYGGAVNPRDADLKVSETADKKSLVFNGRKIFSTGSKVSDLTVLEGVLDNGDHVFAIADSHQPGITYGDDWHNTLGVRGSQSGSIAISNVQVPWSGALGYKDKKFVPLGAYNTLLLPVIQLTFVNVYQGIAEGALAKAVPYTSSVTRPWPFAADVKTAAKDEFYIQEIYGDLQAKIWGSEAHIDRVDQLLQGLLSIEDRTKQSAEARGEVSVRIAAAKVVVVDVGLEVTSKIYEVLGARATSFKAGFDHFWRNLRTHTLHDPIAHKRAEVGRFALSKELPVPSWYT